MTKPPVEFIEWVRIARAETTTEAIMLRMLLNRTCVPYRTQGEFLHQLYGIAGSAISGPVEFLVPAHMRDAAEESLQTIFDVESELPAYCPACDAKTLRGTLECPGCGLVLG